MGFPGIQPIWRPLGPMGSVFDCDVGPIMDENYSIFRLQTTNKHQSLRFPKALPPFPPNLPSPCSRGCDPRYLTAVPVFAILFVSSSIAGHRAPEFVTAVSRVQPIKLSFDFPKVLARSPFLSGRALIARLQTEVRAVLTPSTRPISMRTEQHFRDVGQDHSS